MEIFNGLSEAKKLDNKIEQLLSKEKSSLKKLVIVLVGDYAPSRKYVQVKKKFCKRMGVPIDVYEYPQDSTVEGVESSLEKIIPLQDVGSVLVQLPLPNDDFSRILDLVPMTKDVDLLSKESQKAFYEGDFSRISPVIRALEHFIYSSGMNVSDSSVLVIGSGFLVGKPVAHYLKQKGAAVKTYDLDQGNPYETGKKINADLVVLTTPIPNLVNGEDISEGANVIDFGTAVVDGEIVGNLNMESSLEHLSLVSPAKRGMGPLVVRYLVMNHLGL